MRALAKELDVGPATIHRLESGETVSLATAKQFADYFDIPVTDLPAFRARIET
jgi:DNA-binding XRE family transcriptional regulator